MSNEQNQKLREALREAAISLETISRLAGKAVYPNGDSTHMGTFADVRGYATSRASVAHPTRTLTPVFDGAKDLPVHKGWYPSWPKQYGQDWPYRADQRRYWNGERFSVFVLIGDSDDEQAVCKSEPLVLTNSELYWCGLTAPYKP